MHSLAVSAGENVWQIVRGTSRGARGGGVRRWRRGCGRRRDRGRVHGRNAGATHRRLVVYHHHRVRNLHPRERHRERFRRRLHPDSGERRGTGRPRPRRGRDDRSGPRGGHRPILPHRATPTPDGHRGLGRRRTPRLERHRARRDRDRLAVGTGRHRGPGERTHRRYRRRLRLRRHGTPVADRRGVRRHRLGERGVRRRTLGRQSESGRRHHRRRKRRRGHLSARSQAATVSNVTASDNDVAGVLLDRTRGASVRGASADRNRFGVYLFETTDSEVTGATAVQNDVAGVYAVNTTGTAVSETTATNNSLAGVLLQGVADGAVTSTNASRSRYGVYLFLSESTTVTDSTASDGVMGVYVRNTSGGAVLNNTVLGNSFDGVYLENSTDVRVADNRDGAVVFESTGNETIGAEGGYRHDDAIDVNQSDGLSDAELRAYVYRAIARAEHLRQLEYVGSVSFEVVSQAELGRRNEAEPDPTRTVSAWENQLWEATFVVGEGENSTRVAQNESSRIAGYYNFFADKMVIVSDDDPLTVSSTTLVHEFVHALQDQHFDLSDRSTLSLARTEDGSRARSGLVEGDARYVEERFDRLCGVVWNCVQVESEEPRGGDISSARNFAMRQMVLAPYSDGPNYVETLRQQGDWRAVNDDYDDPPNTTEQVIHPEKRDEPRFPSTSRTPPARGGDRSTSRTSRSAGETAPRR
ncbi:Hvo_1808 family surface protein [Halorussus caseinilyticus]|uniref:Hvo_1808 family surface protein n=1 Tax=Halorussus caseinilyticus TaxID=3034025 RepID=A0ABD5WR28_9EURY